MNNLFNQEPSTSEIKDVLNCAFLTFDDIEYSVLKSYLTAREWGEAYNTALSMVKTPYTEIELELEDRLFSILVNYGNKTKLQQT